MAGPDRPRLRAARRLLVAVPLAGALLAALLLPWLLGPGLVVRSNADLLAPLPIELGDSLRDIGDPELRAVLESLARSLGGQEDTK